MPSTTPFAPNQASGFSVPKTTVSPTFKLNPQTMSIGQFGLPGTAPVTTTPSFSPTQGGSPDFKGGQGVTPTVPTSTGFTAGANGNPVATTASVWNSPAVTNSKASQNTNVSTLPPTPPATSAPTNLNSGAAAGGGLTAEQIAAANAGESATSNDPNINPNAGASPPPPTNPNPTSQNPAGSASSTAGQTNAIIQNLQNIASQGSQGDQAEIDLQNQIKNLETSIGLGQGQIMGTPEPLQFQTGQNAALLAQRNPELQALTQQLAALQANRNASITAGNNAGGIANNLQGLQQQTQPVGIGTGLYSPFSGQTVASNAAYMGGTSGGTNGIINGLVQQLQNGAAWDDVVSQLPSAALAPMLSQAATQAIPGFNPTTSNQNASARNTALQSNATQGITLQRSADSANKALDTLQNFFSQLPSATTGGIPATNSIATWFAQQFGNSGAGEYETTLQDARAQLEGVLTATGATTPTGAEATAKAYLPDGMTPGQFQSKLDAARQLVQQKVAAFTQTGNVPQYQNGTSNSGNSSGGTINTPYGSINPSL